MLCVIFQDCGLPHFHFKNLMAATMYVEVCLSTKVAVNRFCAYYFNHFQVSKISVVKVQT